VRDIALLPSRFLHPLKNLHIFASWFSSFLSAAMELDRRPKNEAFSSSVAEADHDGYSRDDRDLIRLGKKPALKRNFGFMQILGFSCTVLVTWEGILQVSTPSLLNGGPAGVFWGYILIWLGSISVYTVLSELSSMAPTAGGQYQ
jgi:amino acid permease